MRKRYFTELQAWRFVLERFTSTQSNSYNFGGLCAAIGVLQEHGLISAATKQKMYRSVKSQIMYRDRPDCSLWYWGFDDVGTKKRIKAIRRIIRNINKRKEKRYGKQK